MSAYAKPEDFEQIPTIYDSPITLLTTNIHHQLAEEQENMVMKAVWEIGVDIDKDKLLQILNHDQNQYRIAYAAGYSAAKKGYEDRLKQIAKLTGLYSESEDE